MAGWTGCGSRNGAAAEVAAVGLKMPVADDPDANVGIEVVDASPKESAVQEGHSCSLPVLGYSLMMMTILLLVLLVYQQLLQ